MIRVLLLAPINKKETVITNLLTYLHCGYVWIHEAPSSTQVCPIVEYLLKVIGYAVVGLCIVSGVIIYLGRAGQISLAGIPIGVLQCWVSADAYYT